MLQPDAMRHGAEHHVDDLLFAEEREGYPRRFHLRSGARGMLAHGVAVDQSIAPKRQLSRIIKPKPMRYHANTA